MNNNMSNSMNKSMSMGMSMRIGFFTSNNGKLRELQNRLEPLGHEVVQLAIEYPEIQVDTIDEVSRFGIKWVIDILMEPDRSDFDFILDKKIDLIIVEDSGLFVHSLNGFPGVYSKYVFKTLGYSGVLKLLVENSDRSAHFESCICATRITNRIEIGLKNHASDIFLFKGTSNGVIVDKPRGDKGFGYDPIFQPKGTDKTFAEMETDEKNSYSHRGKAMEKLLEYLKGVAENI